MRWTPCVLYLLLAAAGPRGLIGGAQQLESGALGAMDGGECPNNCRCDPILMKAECVVNSTEVYIARTDDGGAGIKIVCQEDGVSEPRFSCSSLPSLPLGGGEPVRLTLQHCAVPEHLGCVAGRLGASKLRRLSLQYARAVRLDEDVADIDEFYYLGSGSDAVTIADLLPLPLPLPSLKYLALNDVNLTLHGSDLAKFPALVNLELGSAHLRALPRGFFAPVKGLRRLKIFNNQIEELDVDDLQDLESLEALSVASNQLESLSSLATLSQLTHLEAFNNRISVLPRLNLTRLQRLDLFYNRAPLVVSPGALSHLPALKQVNLKGARITSLPPDTFHGSSSLTTLVLSNNNLKSVPVELFKDLANLEVLDLSRNGIISFEADLFRPLRSLKVLNLDNNFVSSLPAKWDLGLVRLQNLSIQHNNLSDLGWGALEHARRLRELKLDYNLLHLEPDYDKYDNLMSVFSNLAELRVLSLSHNRLLASPPLSPQAPLVLLDLSYNNITRLTYNDVGFWGRETTADLRFNRISAIHPLTPATRPGAGAGAGTPAVGGGAGARRATMLLDGNPFYCDCQLFGFAQRLHGYTSLDSTEAVFDVGSARCAGPTPLEHRPIPAVPLHEYTCSISDSCPSSCECLLRPETATVELTCTGLPEAYPSLQDFDAQSFKLTLKTKPERIELHASVTVLNMSGLGLKALPAGNLSALHQLDLSYNSLRELPPQVDRAGLTVLLAGNPLSCDCGDEEAVERLKKAAGERRVLDWERVQCEQGERVGEVGAGRCWGRRAGIMGGTLGALGLLAALLALLLVRYSLELRVCLYSKGWCSRWLDDEDDRKYDAFVSFCHKDELFVSQELLPGLEAEPHRYKVCVHYRDWVPGEWIPKQISDSVANSRRTIIVLSQNFLESLWGQAEFRTATMSQVHDDRPRLIVVLLEDVTHKDLCPELKAYLSTNTYLKWGDPWFWQKLRYALPHRRSEPVADTVKQKLASAKLVKAKCRLGALDAQLTPDGVLVNVAHITGDKMPRTKGNTLAHTKEGDKRNHTKIGDKRNHTKIGDKRNHTKIGDKRNHTKIGDINVTHTNGVDKVKLQLMERKLNDELKLSITPEMMKEIA